MEQQVIPVWGHCAFQEAAECQALGPCAFEPAVSQSQSLCALRLAEGKALGQYPYSLLEAPALEWGTCSWSKESPLWGGFLFGPSSDAHSQCESI